MENQIPADLPPLSAILAVIAPLKERPGPLLEVLHALQQAFGFVPESAVPVVANELNLSRAEVHGVLTFYHHFRHHPAGRHVVQVCRAESCQAMQGEALAQQIAKRLKLDYGSTSPDGQITLESVYCLGLCSLSPAVMINGQPLGRVTVESFEQALAGAPA